MFEFEDRHMFKFVCALLGFASIIIPGPIVPIISLIIIIGMLIYKIKRAKESPEGFEELMLDIIIIVIILLIDIGTFVTRIPIEDKSNKYSSSSTQEMTISELAENIVSTYKVENFSQFLESGNHINAIKSGFTTYLKDELDISDVSINGNRITCNIETDQIIFTVIKNDIKYTIRKNNNSSE